MLNGESKQQFASFLLFYEIFFDFQFCMSFNFFQCHTSQNCDFPLSKHTSSDTPICALVWHIVLASFYWMGKLMIFKKNKPREIWRTLCFIVTILAFLKRIWQSLLYFLNKFQSQYQINLGQSVIFQCLDTTWKF